MQAAASQLTQGTILALVIVAALFVIGLLVLLGLFLWRTKDPLRYGNFFVVSLGITAALMGFLVAFPLLISDVFNDPNQVLTMLSALFGAIVALVGTYFGIRASSDAVQNAQDQAFKTIEAAFQAQGEGGQPGRGEPTGGGPPGRGGPPGGGTPGRGGQPGGGGYPPGGGQG